MSPRLAQIIGGCIQMMFMFGSILPTFTLDRMGRRKTMMLGCAGLGVCMLMIAALLSQSDNDTTGHAFASASVAFFFLYMLIFGMSVNCVPWVYVPEILPLSARSEGTAIGISANWLWNFVVVSEIYLDVEPLASTDDFTGHDHASDHQSAPVEGIPDFHGHEPRLCADLLHTIPRNVKPRPGRDRLHLHRRR